MSRLRKATCHELEDLSHYTAKPLARKLERSHPEISARVYCALCMRIINAGKSKYYHAALDNIERAKKCYDKAGLNDDWQAVVADERQRHFRKKGFMAGFEDIVSGAPKHVEPPSPEIIGVFPITVPRKWRTILIWRVSPMWSSYRSARY